MREGIYDLDIERLTHEDDSDRRYSTGQIAFAAFLAGPFAGLWLIGRNFIRFGQPDKAKLVVAFGLVWTVIAAWLALRSSEDAARVLTFCQLFAVWLLARHTQGSALSTHRDAGGRFGSWLWVGAAAALGFLTMLVITGVLGFALGRL